MTIIISVIYQVVTMVTHRKVIRPSLLNVQVTGACGDNTSMVKYPASEFCVACKSYARDVV